MLNDLTKQKVIETLISLRDREINENTDKDMTLKERWYIPDCLAFAINFMENQKDE